MASWDTAFPVFDDSLDDVLMLKALNSLRIRSIRNCSELIDLLISLNGLQAKSRQCNEVSEHPVCVVFTFGSLVSLHTGFDIPAGRVGKSSRPYRKCWTGTGLRHPRRSGTSCYSVVRHPGNDHRLFEQKIEL